MKINWKKLRGVFYKLIAFAVGCLAVAVPFFFRASFIHADEIARQEQTMEPGITMFMGLIVAPLGGAVAVLLWRWFRHRKASQTIIYDSPREDDLA